MSDGGSTEAGSVNPTVTRGLDGSSNRERILIGMATSVGQSGYRGSTITDVVRHARISKRTFYEEFDDKESCFLELYRRVADILERVLRDALAEERPWREQIRAGARAYYDALAAQPVLTKAFFIEIATLSDRATAIRRQAFDHFGEVIIEHVERDRLRFPQIPSRPLAPLMSVAIMGGLTEVMISRLERDVMPESVDELVDLAEELIASAVLVPDVPDASGV